MNQIKAALSMFTKGNETLPRTTQCHRGLMLLSYQGIHSNIGWNNAKRCDPNVLCSGASGQLYERFTVPLRNLAGKAVSTDD